MTAEQQLQTDNRPLTTAEIHARGEYWRQCGSRACRRWMVFVKTRAGKLLPFTHTAADTWTPHFWDCPEAGAFSRKEAARG